MENKEQKVITNIYAALCVSLVMSFLPMMTAAGLALIMFMGVLTASYVLRGRTAHDSLIADHMTFIIRTVWISGFLSLTTMTAAGLYIAKVVNPSEIMSCVTGDLPSDTRAIMAMIQPCMPAFLSSNMLPLINALLLGAGPVVIYMVYRIVKGLSRALKGHRIGDVKNWL